LMRGGQQELRTGIASHFSPGLAALPHFQTMVFITRPKSRTMQRVTRQLMLPPSTVT
jgi:hypothetical protein